MLMKMSIAGLLCVPFAFAGTVIYTSSAAFEAAVSVNQTENYGTATVGSDISSGGTLDGLTYSGFVLTQGGTKLDIIGIAFNSFSGKSLGADHTSVNVADTFFFGGEGATITFASPVTAFGMFFNVNPNSGNFGFTSAVGAAMTGSATYDTNTFVFAGLTSTVPFSSISFTSSDAGLGVYNVTELLLGTAANASVPEPSTIGLMLGGILLMAAAGLKRRRA